MSTKSSSSSQNENDPCGKDRDILCECKTALIDEVQGLSGVAEASATITESKKETRDTQVCCVLKAEETSKVYRNMDYYVAIDASCKTEQIEKNIDDLIKKSGSLGAAINEAVQCINGIKAKTAELKAKACDLDTQMRDSCNSQQLNILDKHFSGKCEVVKPNDSGSEDCFLDFKDIVKDLASKTEEIWSKSDTAFTNAVNISGIQTFSNVKSLKELSKTVAACVKDFKKNVDENVKGSTDELAKAHDELAKAAKEVATKTMEEHKHTSLYEGTAFALEFVCEPGCDDPKIPEAPTIPDLCDKVRQTLCNDKDSASSSSPTKTYSYMDKNYD